MNPRETRRGLLEIASRASGALLLPQADVFKSPESQNFPFRGGACVFGVDEEYYFLKKERGEPNLVRYKIPDFLAWYSVVSASVEVDQTGVIFSLKEKAVPPAGRVEHWDGSFKIREKFGGTKIIPIMGLGSSSLDENYYRKLKGYLADLGYVQEHFLDPTYKIDRRKKTLGVHYDEEDSLRDPRKVLEDMDLLIDLWKKEYPLNKFWLIGHSNGGYLALELTKRHPDAISGVITLDGTLAGARLPIIPEFLQSAGAKYLRGEAGEFHIKRGFDDNAKKQLEKDVEALRRYGIKVVTFSSIDDPFVPPECAFAENSNIYLSRNSRKINPLFPMGTWTEWIPAQKAEQEPCDAFDLSCILDSPVDSPSAELRERPGETVGRHGAPLVHDQVLFDIRFIFMVTTANDTIKKIRDVYYELHGRLLRPPERQKNFTMYVDQDDYELIKVILHTKQGELDLDNFIRSYGVNERWWIPNLEITYGQDY